MVRCKWLALSILVVSVLSLAACDGNQPPAAPTPPPVVTPPPTPPPPPPPPPPAPAELESFIIDPGTVRSQGRPTGNIKLTAPAPAGGAVVRLESGNPDIAKVPSSMTVQAGETIGLFTVDAATVPLQSMVTIQATYAGVTKAAVLTVNPPPLDARFTVTSASQGKDACAIIDAAGTLDCTLDGSASDGFVARWQWTLKVGSNEINISAGGPTTVPNPGCASLGGGGTPSGGAVTIAVFLTVEDRQGSRSPTVQQNIAMYTNGRCGY